jgi:putative oxidoreductase
MRYVTLAGRILYSLIFLMAPLAHFSAGTIAYAAQSGVPMPGILVPLSGVIGFLGGLSVLLGYQAKRGAWLLVVFLIPVSFAMHAFWKVQDPMMHAAQLAHFMKNVGLLGAALLISQFGAGPMSLDNPRSGV